MGESGCACLAISKPEATDEWVVCAHPATASAVAILPSFCSRHGLGASQATNRGR